MSDGAWYCLEFLLVTLLIFFWSTCVSIRVVHTGLGNVCIPDLLAIGLIEHFLKLDEDS